MQPNDPISQHFRLDQKTKTALSRLKLSTIRDLLYYFPSRYSDISNLRKISELGDGEIATIYGKISKIKIKKSFKTKVPMAEGTLEDENGKIKVIWFNQVYIAKMIPEESLVKLTGKISSGKNGLLLSNPEFEKIKDMPIDTHDSLFRDTEAPGGGYRYPVYRETSGLSSKWLYHAIMRIFEKGAHEKIIDPIPEKILKEYNLPEQSKAFIWIHSPKKEDHAIAARKRFAFEEVFLIQIEKGIERKKYKSSASYDVKIDKKELESFISRFDFTPTPSQTKSIKDIIEDFEKGEPMTRLLEGDVGSGKTFVAAATSYLVATSRPSGKDFGNLQVAYMAPTEILATQHFESFIQFFRHLPIQIALITSSGCKKFPSKISGSWTDISRAQLLKWVANGEIAIVIGTHSLIQKAVKFKHLAYVIIDEQHRFGLSQRLALAKKDNHVPHLLSMTATPIPRTLALTIYGDLDLTLLTDLPKGRKPVTTLLCAEAERTQIYGDIKKRLKEGRQLYVICPRINEPDETKELAVEAKSVEMEARRLAKNIFPEFKIGVLHGKMTKEKKESAMEEFASNKTQILVATSVVEVGVNVPNATTIIIEGAERFGLAQLHQLRGRVLRSSYEPYCYIFSESKSDKTEKRLRALKDAKNGFELAEMDLMERGAGELSGTKQWGVSDVAMEAIKNIKMVEAARKESKEIIQNDPELKKHEKIVQVMSERKATHFE